MKQNIVGTQYQTLFYFSGILLRLKYSIKVKSRNPRDSSPYARSTTEYKIFPVFVSPPKTLARPVGPFPVETAMPQQLHQPNRFSTGSTPIQDISYSCMSNIKTIINSHNHKIMRSNDVITEIKFHALSIVNAYNKECIKQPF